MAIVFDIPAGLRTSRWLTAERLHSMRRRQFLRSLRDASLLGPALLNHDRRDLIERLLAAAEGPRIKRTTFYRWDESRMSTTLHYRRHRSITLLICNDNGAMGFALRHSFYGKRATEAYRKGTVKAIRGAQTLLAGFTPLVAAEKLAEEGMMGGNKVYRGWYVFHTPSQIILKTTDEVSLRPGGHVLGHFDCHGRRFDRLPRAVWDRTLNDEDRGGMHAVARFAKSLSRLGISVSLTPQSVVAHVGPASAYRDLEVTGTCAGFAVRDSHGEVEDIRGLALDDVKERLVALATSTLAMA